MQNCCIMVEYGEALSVKECHLVIHARFVTERRGIEEAEAPQCCLRRSKLK